MYRIVWVLLGISIGMTPAQAATPVEVVFESAIAIFREKEAIRIFTRTANGRELLSRLTGNSVAGGVTESTYFSFLDRLSHERAIPLREELIADLTRFEEELTTARQLATKESRTLTAAAELSILNELAGKAFTTMRYENLLMEMNTFIRVPKNAYEEAKKAFLAAEQLAPKVMSEIPALPVSVIGGTIDTAAALNLQQLKLNWWKALGNSASALRGLFRSLMFGHGRVRTIVGITGEEFAPLDHFRMATFNRIMDNIPDYVAFQTRVRALTQGVTPAQYSRLNQATESAIREYQSGLKDGAAFLRERTAEAARLKINEIVNVVEKEMLETLETLKRLGGGRLNGQTDEGAINLAEENVRGLSERVGLIESELKRLRAEQNFRRGQLKLGNLPHEQKIGLQVEIEDLERMILGIDGQLLLVEKDLDRVVRELLGMYVDFFNSYMKLDAFANLRTGWMLNERVPVFDIPDPFAIARPEIELWERLFDPAYKNAAPMLVKKEIVDFFKTRMGKTRQLIRSINEVTGKTFGKKFTDTPAGQEFKKYAAHHITVTIQRLAKVVVGVTVPASIGLGIEKVIDDFLSGKEPAKDEPKKSWLPWSSSPAPSSSPSSAPSPSTAPKPSASAALAPVPAPASGFAPPKKPAPPTTSDFPGEDYNPTLPPPLKLPPR